jgi:hypothetical protein
MQFMEMTIKNNSNCFHRSNEVKRNLINMWDHFWQQIITNSCSLNPSMVILNFFSQFHRVQNYDCTGFVGLGQSPLPRFKPFCVLLCRFSLVNFMYIVLQIFYQFLFPSIKRMIFIHNKLITILTCSFIIHLSLYLNGGRLKGFPILIRNDWINRESGTFWKVVFLFFIYHREHCTLW